MREPPISSEGIAKRTSLMFVLKVISRCNLNCSYCYVYHKGDETWRDRPFVMSDEVFLAAAEQIRRWCLRSGQHRVDILFHGGEPLLAGSERFAGWCNRLLETLSGVATVSFNLQTNGVLIDESWVRLFRTYNFGVGVSLDGPRDIHDRFRVTRKGSGSYDRVATAVRVMKKAGLPISFLCVIPLGCDGARVQRHFVELGATKVSYLLPDFTHESIAPVRVAHGPTPCADFLIPAFDCWWKEQTLQTLVEPFFNIATLIMGGESRMDILGNRPFGFVFVESDGAIEGLDVFRICGHGKSGTGLTVLRDAFERLEKLQPPHLRAIFEACPLPNGCVDCPEENTCAGGYFPHRWSSQTGFDNPSVWCRDLLKLFGHIRHRLGIDPNETHRRRLALQRPVIPSLGIRE
jgi:uncharacterized protein